MSWEGALTTAIDAVSAADILAGLPNRMSKVIAPHIADRPSDPALVEADAAGVIESSAMPSPPSPSTWHAYKYDREIAYFWQARIPSRWQC